MLSSEQIDVLIGKYLAGEASPEEAMELEDWKQASAENLRYFEEMAQPYGLSTPRINLDAAWQKLNQQLSVEETPVISIVRKKRTNILRIAAGIALLCLLGAVVSYLGLRRTAGQEVDVISYNESRTAKLNDGTTIAMEPHSRITIEPGYNKSERRLRFEGDAAFRVKHNEEKPFSIAAGNLQIKDIGTSFRIKALPGNDTVYVHVTEGIVELSAENQAPLLLKENESAVFLNSSGKVVHQTIEPEAILRPSREFSFRDQSLGTIFAELQEAYGVSIQLEQATVANCRMTVNFDNEPLETVLSIICETHGLRFEKTAEGYLIKGQSCSR